MALATNLTELPSDILLYISQHLGLKDAVSFSMVSTVFQLLAQHRSYWIKVLMNSRRLRPIACVFHEDLSHQSLENLKCIVLHTLRRDRNFQLPEPMIMGPIKSVILEETPMDVIFHVPGTELCVMHSHLWKAVVCWDIGSGKAVGRPMKMPCRRIKDVSPGDDRLGQFSMGVLLEVADATEQVSDQLVIISLRYGKHSEIELEQTFCQMFPSVSGHWAVFMNEEIVGVLRITSLLLEEARIAVVAFNRSSTEHIVIQTDIPLDGSFRNSHFGTSTFGRDVFILIEHREASNCYRCPADLLPYSGNLLHHSESKFRCVESLPLITTGSESYEDQQMGALSADPYYGVPAITLHALTLPESDMKFIRIRFWTRSDDEWPSISSPSSLILKCEVDVPGALWVESEEPTWQLMLIPHSGLQVLLVVCHEDELNLQLVQFHRDSGSASVHLLQIPSFIDMYRVYGLSLDDHRGVISLLDRRGFIFAIPYA